MFDSESIVGDITDPQGSLKVGSVGDTECVYFSYKSDQGDREFHQVYTARELSSLLASAKKAQEMAASVKPRSTIRLSSQPPKPIRLQVVLVAPENKSPLIILRFSQHDWKQDVFTQPAALVELLQKAERRAPMPAVVGILDRFGSAMWMIEGQTLEVRDDLSHGTGYYREYMHHSEVPESTVVRAWPATIDGKSIVVAFEYAQGWEPTSAADLPQGQAGDQALNDGLVRQSREIHALLSKTMFESGRVDPVWSGKVALSSMIGDIIMSDEKTGRATWSGEGGNPVLKAGVKAIREGKLSPHDTAIFSMISAYYHAALGEHAVPEEVDKAMLEAWTYAKFNAPEMKKLILSNWYILLQRVSQGAGGGPLFQTFQEAKSEYEPTLKPEVFNLPPAYPWIKTWKPAQTSESEAEAPVKPEKAAEPQISVSDPLPELPDIPATTSTEHVMSEMAPSGDSASAATPWNDDLMSMDEEKTSKKKSPLPLILVGLLVLGAPAAYFFMSNNGPKPDPSPTPVATTATPTIVQTPAVVATQTPTPPAPVAGPLPQGDIRINGFSLDDKLKEQDIFAAGYEPVDRFTERDKGIARYKGPKGEVIVNFKLPSRVVTAIQGDHLMIGDQKVADLNSDPEAWQDDERFSKFKFQAVLDDENKVRAFTRSVDGIYTPEPLVGAPKKALELSRKIKNKKFFETLPESVANMRFTNGETLIFQFLGSFEIDRLEYLVEQGADPNAKAWSDGSTPLHACKNVKTARALLSLGADPNAINKKAETPYDAAELEELKAVLDPTALVTPTATPEATPSASPTPEESATPEPSTSPTP